MLMRTSATFLVFLGICGVVPANAGFSPSFGGLASTWLHDLDSRICDNMGYLFGSPSIRKGCSRWKTDEDLSRSMELLDDSLDVRLKRDDDNCRCKRHRFTSALLKRERSARRGKHRKLVTAERRLKEATGKIAQLSVRKDVMSQNLTVMASQIRRLESEKRAALEMFRLQLSNAVQSAWVTAFLIAAAIAVVILEILRLTSKRAQRDANHLQDSGDSQKQLQARLSDLVEKLRRLSEAEEQLDLGHALDDQCDSDSLHDDFSFQIFDEGEGPDRMRSVKIKCPGVHHEDVVVDTVCNGCLVTIDRKPSHGVGATTWKKLFQFRWSSPSLTKGWEGNPSEWTNGHFEFAEDQIALEGGFLVIVFQVFQSRTFKFPKQFDMAIDDEEDAWLYSDDRSLDKPAGFQGRGRRPSLGMAAPSYASRKLSMSSADSAERDSVSMSWQAPSSAESVASSESSPKDC